MKQKSKSRLIIGLIIFCVFLVFTLSLKFVDLKPVGPNGSIVAYSTINNALHKLFGVNMTLYNITDWAGVVAILIMVSFAILGLIQWLKRKSILKVDFEILLLGVFYIIVFLVYAFFEFNVINRRPILINGFLEASYPSSTTMLACCVIATAIMQFKRLIKNKTIKRIVVILCYLFIAFMVIARLVSGVHWFTDIIGGLLLSLSLVYGYCGICVFIENKNSRKSREFCFTI